MYLDLILLANLVAHQKGGHVFALVPLQLNDLHKLRSSGRKCVAQMVYKAFDASLYTHLSQFSVLNYCAVAAEILLESLQDLLVVNAFFQTLHSQI